MISGLMQVRLDLNQAFFAFKKYKISLKTALKLSIKSSLCRCTKFEISSDYYCFTLVFLLASDSG